MDTNTKTSERFRQLQSILDLEDIDSSASEVHGIACARACLGISAISVDSWIPLVTGEPLAPGMNRHMISTMSEMVNDISETLERADFDLQILLSDDESVFLQTESIGHWCQGFVLGLLGDGERTIESLPDNAREIVRDFLEIASVDSAADADKGARDTKDTDRALMEIEEYLRVGTQVVFEDLREDLREDKPS